MSTKTPQDHNIEEEQLFTNLRASAWDEFFGQERVKDALHISLEAAKTRGEAVDHMLLYGPPGLGKTTLSHLVAKEMNSTLRMTNGTALTKVADLAAILTNLQERDVLFIDEIHRLPKVIEETLYPAMEDFALDIVIGKGPSARTVRLELPHFTLVGATTRYGLLSGPFRDRFGIVHRLEYYDPAALAVIIERASQKLELSLSKVVKHELAKRSRGTPRIALRMLKRLRDYATLANTQTIEPKLLEKALADLQIDHRGLDPHDRRYLEILKSQFKGKPAGLQALAAALQEDPGTIEEVIEPYLMQLGLVHRTAKGRVLTE
mgnify:CR=1 FL=1